MELTPEQTAVRLRELAAEIPRHAMPREQIAEGFRLIADAIAPAAAPAADVSQPANA